MALPSAAGQDASPCADASDKGVCSATQDENGDTCVWCESGAIPSACYSGEQANMLPPGVFDCDALNSNKKVLDDAPRFLFGGKEYHINAGVVDEEFCDSSSLGLSGYCDITGSKYDDHGENKHYFFWMYEKRGGFDETTPFVIWLNGGPGCSSTMGFLTENGPCSVNEDGVTTTVNPNSWTEAAHVLWLDQPAGVGFSYGDETDKNEEMVSEDAYYFLQSFFQTHPKYANNPLFITGESYAGHYIPAIASRILKGNEEQADGTVNLPLGGIAIGNGLTNPELQYPAYPDMMYNNSHGIQLISEKEYDLLMKSVPACTSMIHKCNEGTSIIDQFSCESAYFACNVALTTPYQALGLNPYDIRLKCEVEPLCYDFSYIENFLNLDSTKEALHIDTYHSHNWESCNYGINSKFMQDWMKDFSGDVAEVLDAGLQALIYVGDVDFICNYIGNEAWTYALEWSGKESFQAAEVHDWMEYGKARTFEKFTYLQVFDAGHMVPTDQPEAALEMMKTFLSGGEF